jgi:PAS domain S-box-containing protein
MAMNGERATAEPGFDLRALIDLLPARVAYWDVSARCRFANRAYARWLGAEPDALRGALRSELLAERGGEHDGPHVARAVRGEAQAFERELRDGGATRHVQVQFVPLTEEGEVRGFSESHEVLVASSAKEAISIVHGRGGEIDLCSPTWSCPR